MGHLLKQFSLEDEGAASEWEELAASVSAGPFMRPGWFRAWQRSFGHQVDVLATGEGSLEAVLPVMPRPGTLRSPVNEHSPGFKAVAADETARVGLLKKALEETPAVLALIKADEETAEAAREAARSAGGRALVEVQQRSPYLDLSGTWESYEKSLSSNFRQGLRRKKRRLGDEGEVSIETHDGAERLEELLTEGFEVEASLWKAEEGTAIASDPVTDAFYRDVARWAVSRGWLRLLFLRRDETCIAFRFDIVCDNTYFHLKGGYDPDFGKFSPGLILQHETVKTAFEDGLGRYEFLGADDPYKMNWTDTVHQRLAVRLFRSGVRGRAAWAARAWAAPAVRRLKNLRAHT